MFNSDGEEEKLRYELMKKGKEQITKQHRNSPYMPIDMSRKALTLSIKHVIEAHHKDLESRGQ